MSLAGDLRLSRSTAAAFAAVGIYWGAFAAQVPVLKAGIGASDGVFGLALLVGAGGAVAAMWLAPLAERRAGRRALPVCAGLMAMGFLLPALAGGPVLFAAAMVAASASSGCLDVIMNARVAALERRRGRALMNLNHGIFSLAYAAAAVLTGAAREAGWPPLAVFTVAGLVTLWLVTEMRRLPEEAIDTPAAAGAAARLHPGMIMIAGLIILIGFVTEQGTEGWSALHLERTLGASAAGGALGPGLLGLTMAIGRIGGQLVVARVAELTVIRWAAVLSACGAVLAALAPNLAVAYAGFAVLGLGVSVTVPMAYAQVGRDVDEAARTLAIARISVIGYMGFFVGPPIMGFLSQGFGLSASFGFIAGLLLVIPLLLVPGYARAVPARSASGV